jgi:hypothetical protein
VLRVHRIGLNSSVSCYSQTVQVGSANYADCVVFCEFAISDGHQAVRESAYAGAPEVLLNFLERELFESTREQWIASEESARNFWSGLRSSEQRRLGFARFDSEDSGRRRSFGLLLLLAGLVMVLPVIGAAVVQGSMIGVTTS